LFIFTGEKLGESWDQGNRHSNTIFGNAKFSIVNLETSKKNH